MTACSSKFLDFAGTNHELKFGFGYRDTPVSSVSVWPGASRGWLDYASTGDANSTLCTNQGLPTSCGIVTLIRDPSPAYEEKYRDVYVGDTMLFGNLTVQAGLRWDNQTTNTSPVSIAGNPLLTTPLSIQCATTFTNAACVTGSDGAPTRAGRITPKTAVHRRSRIRRRRSTRSMRRSMPVRLHVVAISLPRSPQRRAWNFNLNRVYVVPWDINPGANVIARQG